MSHSLTECNIRGNLLDVESAKMFAAVCTEKRIMLFGIKHDQTGAIFENANLKPADGILIANDMSVSSSVNAINVGNNHFDQASSLGLLASMKGKDMVSIWMSHCKLGIEGAKIVAEMVSVMKSLTSINLACNDLNAEAAKALGPPISVSGTLKSIYLHDNKLGAEGTKPIAEAISVSKSLTTLDLRANFLDAEAAKALGPAISKSKSLKEINLSRNSLGPVGAKPIADAISLSRSLTSIK